MFFFKNSYDTAVVLTLNSMIISIPGAMCLTSVHQINPLMSYSASALKFIFPALYGYWLLLNSIDRKIESQPFIKQKLLLLAPFGILILSESILDISFLLSAPPRQISCCTSLLDVPVHSIHKSIVQSPWI